MSEPPPAHTPSFRGRGRGRGRSQAVRAHVARLAQARKAANGRRGRQKLYDHPKPQAASERLKELKAAFSAVANAMRPALEDLADRSLDQLKSSPEAYRAFDQYQEIKSFLDGRYREVLEMHNNQRELDTQLNEYIFQESRAITEEGFIVRLSLPFFLTLSLLSHLIYRKTCTTNTLETAGYRGRKRPFLRRPTSATRDPGQTPRQRVADRCKFLHSALLVHFPPVLPFYGRSCLSTLFLFLPHIPGHVITRVNAHFPLPPDH